MKQQNKIYRIPIDNKLDEKLAAFEKTLVNEEIVSTSVAEVGDAHCPKSIFIVVTKEVHNPHRNLLLEEQEELKRDHSFFCPVRANENKSPEFKTYGPTCTCKERKLLDDETKTKLKKILEGKKYSLKWGLLKKK